VGSVNGYTLLTYLYWSSTTNEMKNIE
jgi:hypothetical protein